MVTLITNAERLYTNAFKRGLTPEPELTIDQWADEKRKLSSEGSAEPGVWRTSRVPYTREIMQCLSPLHPCTKVCFMKPAQIGGTEIIINWWGYTVDLAPAPFLIVESTGDMARKISKQRITTAVRDTPCLNEKIAPARERDSGNTIQIKEYMGGILIIASPTSSALRSTPIRYLALDEVDSYPIDVEGEGDPISLAEKRTATFARRKIFITSTPKLKGISIIEGQYDKSDQRKYYVPCPECKKFIVLAWRGIKFTHEKYKLVSSVEYVCEHCGSCIPEHCKTDMLEQGKWIAENQKNGQFPGFHINALYAPVGWTSWKDIVNGFLDHQRRRSHTLQKTWTNTVLAETWDTPGKEVEYSSLFNRREKIYHNNRIDKNIVVITAGIDTQDDRIEITVIGWCILEESYVLEHKTLYGDLSKPLIWDNLNQFLRKTYLHDNGMMKISCTAIDTAGHYTSRVYEFVQPVQDRRIYAIKGSSIEGREISTKPSRTRTGIYIFSIGTDTAKDTLYDRLGIKETGAGFIHFSDELTEEYFRQLTAEKIETKYVKGFPKRIWVKIRDRNEALDCFVYAIASLHILRYMIYPNYTVTQMLEVLTEQMNKIESEATAEDVQKTFIQRRPAKKSRIISKGVEI